MSESITVERVYQPREGKKYGSVKDTTGKFWDVWYQSLPDFTAGGTYIINEAASREYDGKTYWTIKKYQKVVSSSAPKTNGAAAPSHTFDDNTRRMDIFICGAMNSILSNPNTSTGPLDLRLMDIVELLQTFKQAWLAVFGPAPIPVKKPDLISTTTAPPPQHNEDMNDDRIPF